MIDGKIVCEAEYTYKELEAEVFIFDIDNVGNTLKLCIDCKNYALNSSKGVCHECLTSTSKAVNWEKKQ